MSRQGSGSVLESGFHGDPQQRATTPRSPRPPRTGGGSRGGDAIIMVEPEGGVGEIFDK